jgi:hypothetical protein
VGELGFEVRIAVEKVWESAPHKGGGGGLIVGDDTVR